MIKVTIFDNYISLMNSFYPKNKITFNKERESVRIKTLNGETLILNHYSNFKDKNDVPYQNIETLLQDLQDSYA